MKRAGLSVEVGCGQAEAGRSTKPTSIGCEPAGLCTLKAGMTLDGKITTAAGDPRWITSDEAEDHALDFEPKSARS
ncbi:MAG: hypothetical protein U0361_02060 [Nitrospiraceae bacterium]